MLLPAHCVLATNGEPTSHLGGPLGILAGVCVDPPDIARKGLAHVMTAQAFDVWCCAELLPVVVLDLNVYRTEQDLAQLTKTCHWPCKQVVSQACNWPAG